MSKGAFRATAAACGRLTGRCSSLGEAGAFSVFGRFAGFLRSAPSIANGCRGIVAH
jgi:hypothetical protein